MLLSPTQRWKLVRCEVQRLWALYRCGTRCQSLNCGRVPAIRALLRLADAELTRALQEACE